MYTPKPLNRAIYKKSKPFQNLVKSSFLKGLWDLPVVWSRTDDQVCDGRDDVGSFWNRNEKSEAG
jgi:hypothetical protein